MAPAHELASGGRLRSPGPGPAEATAGQQTGHKQDQHDEPRADREDRAGDLDREDRAHAATVVPPSLEAMSTSSSGDRDSRRGAVS